MKAKLISLFIYLAGGALFATAMAKLISAGGSARVLSLADPLLYLSNRHVLICVALVELIVAGFALFGKNLFLRASLIAWLATNFLIYRIGLVWIGYKKPCGCLGNITDALALSPKAVEDISKGLLGFLLVGGYVSVYLLWKQGKPNQAATSLPPSEPIAT